MKRLSPLAPPLLLACLCAPTSAFAQSIDEPPTMPEGLVARAYDEGSGGIRWERSSDDRGVVGYEVRRDGAVLGTFDSLSYVDFSFAPGTSYRFEVTAIDTAGQRSGTADVTLVTPGGGGDEAGPADPDARAEVYSGTAAELFWTRQAAPGPIYTVVRDGTLVYEGDATSFYDDSLAPGTAYAYDVRATDRQGRNSGTARVTLTTRAGSNGASGNAPAAPSNPSATRYSASAGELFWDRAPAFGLSYEVSRDGDVLGTTTGTSFFDDALPGVGEYRYEVVAIARDGARSAASSATLAGLDGAPTGPDGPDAPVITPDTYVDVLAHAFEIYTGKRFGADILALPGYPVETLDYAPPGLDSDGTVTVSATCGNGGTLVLEETVTGARQLTRTRDYDFDDCQDGAAVYDGELTSRDFGNVGLESTGLDVVDGPRTVRFSGALGYMPFSNRDGGPNRSYGMDGVDYSVAGESPAALTEASFAWSFVNGSFGFGIDGGYRIASPFTAGRELVVATVEPLDFALFEDPAFQADETRPESVRFATGTLVIEDSNGDSLRLVAANGDPLSADVEVVSGGVTERFVQPWSTWANELEFSYDLLDR